MLILLKYLLNWVVSMLIRLKKRDSVQLGIIGPEIIKIISLLTYLYGGMRNSTLTKTFDFETLTQTLPISSPIL